MGKADIVKGNRSLLRFTLLGIIVLIALVLSVVSLMPFDDTVQARIVNTFAHDPNAFTQGLIYHDGWFYESTGLYGRSSVRRVEPDSGKVVQQINLPTRLFGEGLTLFDGLLYQLTWRSGRALVYELDSFRLVREHRYNTQGWGLTHDGTHLIMSDGSHNLYFRDPQTFALQRTLAVNENARPAHNLNELEFIDGIIWANVYRTNDIVRIDPDTGEVIERLSFPELPRPDERNGKEDVLNGIAYDHENKHLFITGKLYSYIYQINYP